MLVLVLITWIHTHSFSGFSKDTFQFNKDFGTILFVFVLIYMGLRPISYAFGDMGTYYKVFKVYASGGDPGLKKDIGFYTLMRFFAFLNMPRLFFFVVTVLYITPLYIAVKKWFPNYYFFAFLILAASFSFWPYGTNGLRNGLATSFIILAFSYPKNKWIMYAFFLLAFSFHSSMMLVIAAYFGTLLFKNPKLYFFIWGLSVFLSLTMGSFWEGVIGKLGFGQEDKLQMYFGDKDTYVDSFSSAGFRWDFLAYSSLAVIIAYYFILIKKINDRHYNHLTSIYLLVNAFWILVIRASFSNRFAYLSWFMMGIIIVYPYLKYLYWRNQFSIIGGITLLYYSFTYYMLVIIN